MVSAGPIRSQLICDELVWDKAIFFSSLRINLSAARLFLLVWTSTSRTSPSAPDSLIGDHDPAFRQQIFDVAEAQREPNIEPDRVLDDFGRKAIAAIADFDHRGWYGYRSATASPPPT